MLVILKVEGVIDEARYMYQDGRCLPLRETLS